MPSIQETFFSKLEELSEDFETIKEAIIYAELIDKRKEIYIAPLNELRSALAHLFIACTQPDKMEREFNEIKEHIDRAGYDTYELIAINLELSIATSLNEFDTDTLSNVFPEYYSQYKPILSGIINELAKIRAHVKHHDSTKEVNDAGKKERKSFSAYSKQIENLKNIKEETDKRIPALNDYRQKKKNEKRNAWVKTVITDIAIFLLGGIIVGLIVAFFTYKYFTKNDANPIQKQLPNTEVAPKNY